LISKPDNAYYMFQDGIGMIQPDDCRINMSDPWQVLWWSRNLGLTKTELETAIQASGDLAIDIKDYLASPDAGIRTDQPTTPSEHTSGSKKGRAFLF